MKIKIVNGIDMRLWKFNLNDDEPDLSLFNDLITYICKTWQFDDAKQFKIKFTANDGKDVMIDSQKEFENVYVSAKKNGKKSIKIFIITNPIKAVDEEGKEEKEEKAEEMNDDNGHGNGKEGSPSIKAAKPSKEEISAFLNDEFVADLLCDLFCEIYAMMKETNFEISFIECFKGIILSSSKYEKITTNKVYPYFEEEILEKYSDKIDNFVIPMMRLNANNDKIKPEMIRQWIPMVLNMMKMEYEKEQIHEQASQCMNDMNGMNQRNGCGAFGGRFGGGGIGAMFGNMFGGMFGPPPPPPPHGQYQDEYYHGPPHHHHGRHHRGHRRGHRGHRRGHRGRRGHHGHHHGHHGHHGPHHHQGPPPPHGPPPHHGYHHDPPPPHHNGYYDPVSGQWIVNDIGSMQNKEAAKTKNMDCDEDDMIEEEVFAYTEELVAIMAMGFSNMEKIKKLLNEHNGNKQNVVNTLILSK